MPRLDPARCYSAALTYSARERARWRRCASCGERMYPSIGLGVSTHPLCSDLPPDVWDKAAGWAR